MSDLEDMVHGLGKFIGQILVAGAIVFSASVAGDAILGARSNDFPEYHFAGNVREERVVFYESGLQSRRAVLAVERSKGHIIEYIIEEVPGHTLSLENVVVVSGGQRTPLSVLSPSVEADFRAYLNGILEAKVEKYK